MRRKTSKPLLVGDILQDTLKRRNIPIDCRDQEIVTGWEKTVGPVIFQQTRPEKIRNRTLYLKVSSSIWMQQLQFMKAELIEKVNAALGKEAVDNIFFNVGVIEPQPVKVRKEVFRLNEKDFPLKPRDRRIIEESLAEIKDPELGKAIERAMRKGIIRRKMIDEGKSR
ncbi:MAG: DUF721 domain-containing protein [Syntrophaceae bacterium]